MGKGSSGNDTQAATQSSALADEMALISRDYYGQTKPARSNILGRGNEFLAGNYDPSSSPLYAPGKFAAEQQFGTARDNIMSTMPEGGGLYDALAGANVSKAGALTGLEANISQDFFDKIYGAAFGAPQTAVSGLGGAGGIMGNLAGQQAQSNAAQSAGKSGMLGGFGQGVGSYMGGKS